MFLLTIYGRAKGEREIEAKDGGGDWVSCRFLLRFIPMYIVSLYLCIWAEGLRFRLCIWGGRGIFWGEGRGEIGFSLWVFVLGFFCVSFVFLPTIYGDFVSPTPVVRPVDWRVGLSCRLTISGYGFSYCRRRKGDRGALGGKGRALEPSRLEGV